jgi:hypothetical protein
LDLISGLLFAEIGRSEIAMSEYLEGIFEQIPGASEKAYDFEGGYFDDEDKN